MRVAGHLNSLTSSSFGKVKARKLQGPIVPTVKTVAKPSDTSRRSRP